MHSLLTTYLVTVRVRTTVEHALDLARIALRRVIDIIVQLLVELGPLLRSQGFPRRCPRGRVSRTFTGRSLGDRSRWLFGGGTAWLRRGPRRRRRRRWFVRFFCCFDKSLGMHELEPKFIRKVIFAKTQDILHTFNARFD